MKDRIAGSHAVTVTTNEILTALNKPDDFIPALVEVPAAQDSAVGNLRLVQQPLTPDRNGCKVRYVPAPVPAGAGL